jgi:hypothetical protein
LLVSGALFASQFCIGIYGLFFIFDNDWKRKAGNTSMKFKVSLDRLLFR